MAGLPRIDSSSSERRDESEDSRSGGTRDRLGRGGRRAAQPMTPPHRPPPPSTSPRRSQRLSQPGAAGDYRRLPLSMKNDRRTAHSRSASGDECGRHPSQSSRSSLDHGWSGQGRRSRLREPTPPQLMNFNIDNFTVVSHMTDSFTFTSAHPFFPGWVRVVAAHRTDRVSKAPCPQNPEEDPEAKKRVRQDVEPPEVRRFLRQELLRKVAILDISSLPALRDLSTGASTMVSILWPPAGMEQATLCGDRGRPRLWRSSWEDGAVSTTATGAAS